MKCAVVLSLLLAGLALPGLAYGFHHHGQFQEVADGGTEIPGPGKLYYTGSRRDLGLRCSHCHTDAPGRIRADITFSPSLDAGRWVPGTSYDITVAMTGENKGLTGCGDTPNRNGLTAMVVGPDGLPIGEMAPDRDSRRCGSRFPPVSGEQTTVVYGHCDAAVGVQSNGSLTSWRMQWRAPEAGGGEATLWVGVVDGNCAFDLFDDDVYETQMEMPEGSTASLWPGPEPPQRVAGLGGRPWALPPRRGRLQRVVDGCRRSEIVRRLRHAAAGASRADADRSRRLARLGRKCPRSHGLRP